MISTHTYYVKKNATFRVKNSSRILRVYLAAKYYNYEFLRQIQLSLRLLEYFLFSISDISILFFKVMLNNTTKGNETMKNNLININFLVRLLSPIIEWFDVQSS